MINSNTIEKYSSYTYYIYLYTHVSCINCCTCNCFSKQAFTSIINPDWDFNKMGIGGLDNEFSAIFRRAFASRVFPPEVIEQLGKFKNMVNRVLPIYIYISIFLQKKLSADGTINTSIVEYKKNKCIT